MVIRKRKHISWKTKCAAAILDGMLMRERYRLHPGRWYDDAKLMTEDQFLSLFNFDHSILHSSEDEDCDKFWNLAPMLILDHREKTKTDAKIVAKSKRIRKRVSDSAEMRIGPGKKRQKARGTRAAATYPARTLQLAQLKTEGESYDPWKPARTPRKLRSRGFNRRLKRKLDGTVVKR
jgi:hypothetical protein